MPHGKCLQMQNARGARKSSFAAFLFHNSLAECFTKKKNKQHFHDHAAYDYSREYKSRWSVTTIRMAYVAHLYNPGSLNTCIPKVWRPENDGFSLFCHELQHLPAEILDL